MLYPASRIIKQEKIKSLFYSAKFFYATNVSKKKVSTKSFLLDFGYVESVGSV